MRWIEDTVAAFRALAALTRLLLIVKLALQTMREQREGLHERVMELAVGTLGLPMMPMVTKSPRTQDTMFSTYAKPND